MDYKPLQLIEKIDHAMIFDIHITYSDDMNTLYVAIFHEIAHANSLDNFLRFQEISEFNSGKKVNIIYCGKGNKRMLLFAISTIREAGIQIKQHELSAITFDENMLEECLRES